MKYVNGTFYLQNMEGDYISASGADAYILMSVFINMMNSRVDLSLDELRDAFYAMGGTDFNEALRALEEEKFINPDTNEIFIRQSQPLKYEYHIGSYTFHFFLYSQECQTAFEKINNAPPTRKIVPRASRTQAPASTVDRKVPVVITRASSAKHLAAEGAVYYVGGAYPRDLQTIKNYVRTDNPIRAWNSRIELKYSPQGITEKEVHEIWKKRWEELG